PNQSEIELGSKIPDRPNKTLNPISWKNPQISITASSVCGPPRHSSPHQAPELNNII
ncbi:hypothetical protein TorRG33x02_244480, partial [Trema orientale]